MTTVTERLNFSKLYMKNLLNFDLRFGKTEYGFYYLSQFEIEHINVFNCS